jgi:hypothetical protein
MNLRGIFGGKSKKSFGDDQKSPLVLLTGRDKADIISQLSPTLQNPP